MSLVETLILCCIGAVVAFIWISLMRVSARGGGG